MGFLGQNFCYWTIVTACSLLFQQALVRLLQIKFAELQCMTSSLITTTAMSALSRETLSKETPNTAETHVQKRLKRL
jgi:hypothetical protein